MSEVIDLAGTDPELDKEILTYERFGIAVRELATMIDDSGFRPDWIVAIARGGLVIGGALAYALGHKNIATINVEFYSGVDQRLEVPVMLPPVLDLADLAATTLLLVDDVADTGETLQLVQDTCRPHVEDLRTAVLYEKSRSMVSADYAWRRTDRWIEFPWSAAPPIGSARFD